MKVKDLKRMLEGVDDEIDVLIPMDMGCFDDDIDDFNPELN